MCAIVRSPWAAGIASTPTARSWTVLTSAPAARTLVQPDATDSGSRMPFFSVVAELAGTIGVGALLTRGPLRALVCPRDCSICVTHGGCGRRCVCVCVGWSGPEVLNNVTFEFVLATVPATLDNIRSEIAMWHSPPPCNTSVVNVQSVADLPLLRTLCVQEHTHSLAHVPPHHPLPPCPVHAANCTPCVPPPPTLIVDVSAGSLDCVSSPCTGVSCNYTVFLPTPNLRYSLKVRGQGRLGACASITMATVFPPPLPSHPIHTHNLPGTGVCWCPAPLFCTSPCPLVRSAPSCLGSPGQSRPWSGCT
jgi:hypothetical protein